MSNGNILLTDVFGFFWKKKVVIIFINILVISMLFFINYISNESFIYSYILSQPEKKETLSVISYNDEINILYKDSDVKNPTENIDDKYIFDKFSLIANSFLTKKSFYFENGRYKKYIDKKGNIEKSIKSSIEFNQSNGKLIVKSSDNNAEYYSLSYVKFVNQIVNKEMSDFFEYKLSYLKNKILIRINNVNFEIHSKIESEIYFIKTNLKVANQAGIINPLVGYNQENSDLFNIYAGSKILSAKLQSLKSIKKSDYIYLNHSLINLNQIMMNEKSLSKKNITFKSYKLKESTNNPLSNKPSSLFVLLFSLFLGGVISLLYVVNSIPKARYIK